MDAFQESNFENLQKKDVTIKIESPRGLKIDIYNQFWKIGETDQFQEDFEPGDESDHNQKNETQDLAFIEYDAEIESI